MYDGTAAAEPRRSRFVQVDERARRAHPRSWENWATRCGCVAGRGVPQQAFAPPPQTRTLYSVATLYNAQPARRTNAYLLPASSDRDWGDRGAAEWVAAFHASTLHNMSRIIRTRCIIGVRRCPDLRKGMMSRTLCGSTILVLLLSSRLAAQSPVPWQVRGDTSGAPRGCGALAGIRALDRFVSAMNVADSVSLVGALALRRRYVYSVMRFVPSHEFFVGDTVPALLGYARERRRYHERLTLQAVTFNGWRGDALQFGPVYFLRTADDVPNSLRHGIGKGGYVCGEGLAALNVAPRPKLRPGTRMRADQAYPP